MGYRVDALWRFQQCRLELEPEHDIVLAQLFRLAKRTSSLIVPGGTLVEHRAESSALNVLNEVLMW